MVHGVQVERATVRTTWTPWAASARLCLGRRWTGWEPPTHAPTSLRSATAPPPSRCRPIPRRRHHLVPADDIPPLPACTPRAAWRGQPGRRQRQAAPQRRRAPAPCAGLDEVGKILSRWDELLAVVASHMGAVAVQGVQEPDRVDLGHALADLVGGEPGDGCRLT